MSILDKEPNLPLLTPRSLSSMRGAFRVIVNDPIKAPSKYSHDAWYVNFIEESVRKIPGWNSEYIAETPEITGDQNEILLLVARSDGKSWPLSVGKSLDFERKITRLANWAMHGRLFTLGKIPSPSKLIRSSAVEWDVSMKEQWAVWWDQVWPNVVSFGSIISSPRLLIGDETAWMFAEPGDCVVSARGLTPSGLEQKLRSILISKISENNPVAFSRVDIAVGTSWAESQDSTDQKVYEAKWGMLCEAFRNMAAILDSEGYGAPVPDDEAIAAGEEPLPRYSFMECVPCHPDIDPNAQISLPLEWRNYAKSLVNAAALNYMPITPLKTGAWQEPEAPGVMSTRFIARTGAGVEPRFRTWSHLRKKRK